MIDILRQQYLHRINIELPALAKKTRLPVRFNHCFARIILDNLFEDCWYNHLSRQKPAYQQLTETQLKQAIYIADQMLENPLTVTQLNNNSLRWRGHR